MADSQDPGICEEQIMDQDELIPGFSSIDSFSKEALRALMTSIKSSNELPSAGDDFDYYSSFESFRELMSLESQRLLSMIQQVMRYHGAKGNLTSNSDVVEIEDRFDILIDANDQMLERIGTFLDEAAGLKKEESPLVVASVAPKGPVSGSWNKKKLATNLATPSSFRLLAARNIQRPQIKFKDKVDNTNRPFVPKLRHKPNALKPIPESILDAQNEDVTHTRNDEDFTGEEMSYPHPYQYELDVFTPSEEQLQLDQPQEPSALDSTPFSYITTKSDLLELCDTLKEETAFAIDLEHHSYRSYQGITCLMQISTRSQDYIIDCLDLRADMHILNEVFTNPAIVKVLHGADSDIEWLQKDFGLYIVNLFDTGQASRVLNFSRFSLAHLLAYFCKVEADKQYQLADWRMRPLPDELVRYAREDTHYLLYIYDKLKEVLIEKGNEQKNLLHAVIQRSTQICAKAYEKPRYKKDSHLEFYLKSKKVFNNRQMAAYKAIHQWRDRTGRLEDESCGYVLPNHMLMQIAEMLPREQQGIVACCNPIPPLVRQSLAELHQIVQEARDLPLNKVETPKSLPKTLEKKKIDFLECPHDFSHPTDKPWRIPQRNFGDATVTGNLFRTSTQTSALYGDKQADPRDKPVLKDTPLVSVFASLSKGGDLRGTSGKRKATAIQASMRSPFEKFLPKTQNSRGDKPDRVRKPALNQSGSEPAVGEMWKLLPASAAKKSNPVTKVVREEVVPTVDLGDEDVGGMIPLSQQAQGKKKIVLKRKSADETELVEAAIKVSKTDEKQRKDKLKLDELEKIFKKHEYSAEDYKEFEGGKEDRGKKKDYHPDQLPEKKFKNPSKIRVHSDSGKKSQSFGKDKGSKKIQWPKR